MGFFSKPVRLYEILFELVLNDYIPILAHPERYLFLSNEYDEILKLKKVGCKFQINLNSTVGHYGPRVLNFCNFLLEKGLVDFVGSDIHCLKDLENFNKKIKVNEIEKLENAVMSTMLFK